MKFFNKISAFLPWIAYSIFAKFLPNFSLAIAIAASFLTYKQLFRGFILEWSNLIIFLSAFISLIFFNNPWINDNISMIMSVFFFGIVIISLLINKPFTMQYAKLQTDKKFWNSFLFLRINKIMTLVFGLIFLIVTSINIFGFFHPNIINNWIVWIIALTIKVLFIKHFPNWYKKRYLIKNPQIKYTANENSSN